MDSLKTSFLAPLPFSQHNPKFHVPPHKNPKLTKPQIICSISPDPWTLSDGNNIRSKPFRKTPRRTLSDDNARRIINAKARYLSQLRKNQGSHAQTPRWIRRTPEQMVRFLEDERSGHLYGKHVVAAIQLVRSLSAKPKGSYNMREVMSSFVTKLTFREMCVVLKEQKGWRQVRDFFAWMKLQVGFSQILVLGLISL